VAEHGTGDNREMEAQNSWFQQEHNIHDDQLIPLTMAVPGKELTIVGISGGKGIKHKLYSMGLTPGVHLRVMNNGAPGPFMVAVRDFKVALGYGVAQKILVR